MNKVTLLLLGTTFIFGGTTIYYYGEANDLRARAESEIHARIAAETRVKKSVGQAADNPSQLNIRASAIPVSGVGAQGATAEELSGAVGKGAMLAGSAATGALSNTAQRLSDVVDDKAAAPSSSMAARTVLTPEQIESSPEGAAAMREMRKNATRNLYGDLAKELKLNKDDADKLMDLIADRMTRGVASNPQVTDGEVLSLLGSDKYAQYQDYQKHLMEHVSISQLRTQLAGARSPLPTAEQERSLYTAMVEAKASSPMPTPATLSPGADVQASVAQWLDDNDRRTLEQAQKILTPEQFDVFRSQTETQQRMRRVTNGAGGAARIIISR